MRNIKRAHMLTGLVLLSVGASGSATADVQSTVRLAEASQPTSSCAAVTAERARLLADEASQDGAYQRAGECYLVAGQQNLADQAFVKASAQSKAGASRRLASNLNEVKAQARQVRQAFQHR